MLIKTKRQSLFIVLVFFFVWMSVGAQYNQSMIPKQMKDTLMALYNTDNMRIEKLKAEILAEYESRGETGVRNFVKERRNELTLPLILEIADVAFTGKNKPWLKISLILTEEKKNEKALEIWMAMVIVYNTNISSNFSEYLLYESLHILAKMEMCMCLQSLERGLECLENLITQVEKITYPKAQEVLAILKTSINALKKDFNKMEKVFDNEIILMKDKGNLQHQGNMYLGKGALYINIGNYVGACEMFEKALQLYEKSGDMKGQGNVYMLWGSLYRNIGENKRACDMFDKAFPFFEKIGDIPVQCIIYRRKAQIHEDIGEHLKTIEMYDKALCCLEITKNNREKAVIYLAKGHIYHRTGNRLKAREMYNHALALFENDQDILEKRNVYEAKGVINFINGYYSNAIDMYERAVPFYTYYGHFEGKGHLYNTLGEIHFMTGSYLKAVPMYNQALQEYQKTGTSELLSHTLHRKAQVLEKLGKKDDALFLFEEAIKKLEKIRRKTGFSWMKLSLMEKVYSQFEEAAVFMLKNKYYDKGFNCIDSMKARVFLDQLAEGLVKMEKGITVELLQKRDALFAKLSLLSKEINIAAQKKNEEKLKKLKNGYQKTEFEFKDLLVKIRLENPLYASVQYPEPITIADLQKDILKANEVLIQYFITAEKIYVFLVSRKDFKVVALAIKYKDIQSVVNRYFIAVNKKDTGKMIEYGKKIYQAIFKPLETSLEMDKDIIIVPDRQLATMPFESFVIDDTNPDRVVYLLEKYRLKYIQSASALSFLRKYHKKKDGTSHFVGFGDPVYDYENFKQGKPERGNLETTKGDGIKEIHRGKYDREGGIYSRLQGSGHEVETIAGLFKNKNQKSTVYLRAQANEVNAKAADMKEYDYIHFSCHGILGDGFQSLVLSQLPQAKEDGYLTLNELMNCDYNAKLVVLSACQTGAGKMERAEGVMGLTRAVMYAGTPCAVVSLWNVSEMGTKELMVKFYKKMLEKKMSKEEALRQAKLAMIKGNKYASPYFWSPFVMYGE